MKHFIILLVLICTNLNSKLQAQENENHQETFAKFIITNGTVNGDDITPRLINEKAYLTRWVQLNDLNFNIIYWSAKDKFVHVLYQC